MSKSQRTKGAAGEREVVGILRDELGIEVARNLDQSRDGGCDITLQVAGKAMALEVKRQERASVPTWLAQVGKVDAEYHAVVWRPSRQAWTVCLPLADFIKLVREAGVA